MALISLGAIDAVVAIGVRDSGQPPKWMATGFVFGVPVEKLPDGSTNYNCYLVTNRHVLEGPHAIVLRFNPSAAGQQPVDIDIELRDDLGLTWAAHPEPNVDVAAMGVPISFLEAGGLKCGLLAREHALNLDEMKGEQVSEGDAVFIVGFPLGLNAPAMQYAIVRSGCIARIRDAYDAKRGPFLIDASVFPGNSGGPVFISPEVTALVGTKPHRGSRLVGVVHAYVPYVDAAVSQQTGRPRVTFEENSGLALVESVDAILETCKAAQGEWDKRFPPPPAQPALPAPEAPTAPEGGAAAPASSSGEQPSSSSPPPSAEFP